MFKIDSKEKIGKKSKDMDFLESMNDIAAKSTKENDNVDSFDSIFNKELDLDIGMNKYII